jgi:ComF family protein
VSFSAALHALGDTALDLLVPPTCPGCGAGLPEVCRPEELPFCPPCELAIAPRDPAGCVACDRAATRGGLCHLCHERLDPLSRVWATFDYEGPIAAAIQKYKYEGRDDLAIPLSRRWLVDWPARPDSDSAPLQIAPVPLHPERLAARGYDQAWLLARQIARALGVDAVPRALRRVRATPAQVGLGREARATNVAGAFAADPLIADQHLLLIDDVLTTGATLQACARALIEGGARSVQALVVARAQP